MSSTGYSYQLLNIFFLAILAFNSSNFAFPAMTANDYCSTQYGTILLALRVWLVSDTGVSGNSIGWWSSIPGKVEKASHHGWRNFPINTTGLLCLHSGCRWKLSSIEVYGPIPTKFYLFKSSWRGNAIPLGIITSLAQGTASGFQGPFLASSIPFGLHFWRAPLLLWRPPYYYHSMGPFGTHKGTSTFDLLPQDVWLYLPFLFWRGLQIQCLYGFSGSFSSTQVVPDISPNKSYGKVKLLHLYTDRHELSLPMH